MPQANQAKARAEMPDKGKDWWRDPGAEFRKKYLREDPGGLQKKKLVPTNYEIVDYNKDKGEYKVMARGDYRDEIDAHYEAKERSVEG